MIEERCPNCGRNFKSEKWRKQKFCSVACTSQYYGKKRKIETQQDRICEECDKVFTVRKGDKDRFCSSDCARKNMVRKRDEGKRVWWECPICHKKFYWQKSKAKIRKYCSTECQARGASLRLRGIKRKGKVARREIGIYPNPERIYVKGKRKLLHRYLVEKELGRELKTSEQVHHIDMDKQNNIVGNLYLYKNGSGHMKGHHSLEKMVSSLIEEGIIGFKNGLYFRQRNR